MTWSYSGDPSKTPRDWIRWRVGDTNFSDQLQSDEEIDAAISQEGNKFKAAILVCLSIGAKISGSSVDKTIGRFKISKSQAANRYLKELPLALRAEMGRRAIPFAGGISRADKESRADDTDRVKPAFSRGMHDFPGNSELNEPGDNSNPDDC